MLLLSAQSMAPYLALQEALDQRETEGTQDPEETKVHLNRADERITAYCITVLVEQLNVSHVYR